MAAHNEFWTDTVKRLKRAGKNQEIAAVCKSNLPLPGAFSEMAVALRKQIRERRKGKERYNDLLRQLYHAAVWHNFFSGFDALCFIDQADSCKLAARFIPRIKCDYSLIGYEYLDMLGVNDVKWIVESWGEPNRHETARSINQELYARAVARYKLEKKREQRSAGRLFGGQQLKLTDPDFGRGGDGAMDRAGTDKADPRVPGGGNQKKRMLVISSVIAMFVFLVVLLLVT